MAALKINLASMSNLNQKKRTKKKKKSPCEKSNRCKSVNICMVVAIVNRCRQQNTKNKGQCYLHATRIPIQEPRKKDESTNASASIIHICNVCFSVKPILRSAPAK